MKKVFMLILVLVGFILILGMIALFQPKSEPVSSPGPVVMQSPLDKKIISRQKTVIGKTTKDEVKESFDILNEQTLDGNKTSYSVASPLDARPDQIIVQNDKAFFERLVLVGRDDGSEKISSFVIKFGPAEKIYTGSKYYGDHMTTYIYAGKGFAFIANDNADEIYEIQYFNPTTVESYIAAYGSDILLNPPEKKGE